MMYTLALLGPASKDYFSSTFGIFSEEDEFRPEIDFFASVYSPRSKGNANIEWISDEGHELTKLQLKSALKSAFDFFRIEKEAVCDASLRHIGKLGIHAGTLVRCDSRATVCIIPDDVDWIAENALRSCSRLESVVIPVSVTEIETKAFFYTKGPLKDVRYEGTVEQWVKNVDKIGMAFDESQVPYVICSDGNVKSNDYDPKRLFGREKIEAEKKKKVEDLCNNMAPIVLDSLKKTYPQLIKKRKEETWTEGTKSQGTLKTFKEAILEIACIHPDIQSVKISLNYNDVLQWKEPLQTFLESMKEVLPLHEVLKLIDKYKFSCATPYLRITEKRGMLTNGGGDLNYLIIPKNVSVIKKYALQNCRYVFAEIPLSVKKIEDGIFYNCRNLKDVYYEGTIEQWAEVKKRCTVAF